MGQRGKLAGTEKRGAPTGIRFDPELKRRLTAAARAGRRSFSEEVAARLEASFDSFDPGDPETRCLLAAIGYALVLVKDQTGKAWFENAWDHQRATEAIDEVLAILKPVGSPEVPNDTLVLKALRAQGLSDLVEKVTAQLRETKLGKLAGKEAVHFIEVAGESDASIELDRFKSFAPVMKRLLAAADAEGEALNEIKAAAGQPGSGVKL